MLFRTRTRMDATVSGTCTLTREDYQVQMSAMLKRLGRFSSVRLAMDSAIAGFVAAGFALGGSREVAWVFFAVSLVCFIGAIVVSSRAQQAQLRCYLAAADKVISLDDLGVTVTDVDGSWFVRWNHLDEAVEAPTHFLLHHCRTYIVLPKRAFSDEALKAARASITTHVQPKLSGA